MKIDYLKLANFVRWGCCILLAGFALLAIVAICTGRFQYIVTFSGSSVLAWIVGKHW